MTRSTKRARARESLLVTQEHVVQVGADRIVGPWPSAVGAVEWAQERKPVRLVNKEPVYHIRPRRPDDAQIETPEDFLKSPPGIEESGR